MSTIALLYPIPIGERSIAMNMSVCLSLCPIAFIGNDMTRIGQMFDAYYHSVAVARSSSGCVAIGYVRTSSWCMTTR